MCIRDRRKTVANSILLAILTSLLLLVASEFLARPVLELLQTPDTIIDDSLKYPVSYTHLDVYKRQVPD